MSILKEEGTDIPEFVDRLLRRLELEKEDLARLLNIHPITVEKWIDGQSIDLGCAYVLLDLLWDYPDDILYLLGDRERQAGSPGPSWPSKIKSIRNKNKLSTNGLMAVLQTSRDVLARYERGLKEPGSCYAVLIDLLYRYPEKMMGYLATQEKENAESDWTKKRVQELLAKLGMTTIQLADLIGVIPASVREWIYGTAPPGHCAFILIELLYWEPKRMMNMLQRIEPEEPSSWPGTRVRAAREAMAVNPGEFATLLGMHYDTLRVWEADGLPQKTGCPVVLYSLLEKYPRDMKSLIVKFRI